LSQPSLPLTIPYQPATKTPDCFGETCSGDAFPIVRLRNSFRRVPACVRCRRLRRLTTRGPPPHLYSRLPGWLCLFVSIRNFHGFFSHGVPLPTREHFKPEATWGRISAIRLTLTGRWCYGFFLLLRRVVSGSTFLLALMTHDQDSPGWMWVMVGILILFNPLVPIHLRSDTWRVLELLAAGIFVGAALWLQRPSSFRRGSRSAM